MPRMSRRVFLVLLLGIVLFGPTPLRAAAAQHTTHLTLLQVNDVYSIRPVEGGKRGGLARVATLRDRIASESPHTLFVLPGDFISPSTMSSMFQGSQMVATLNAAGLNLATFGNHEFDFGTEITRERIRQSAFTWVSANVIDPGTGLPFGGAVPFVLRDFDGIRLAVFGLVTPETHALSKGAIGLKFLDPIQTAKDVVARVRRLKADVIVALTHQNMEDDKRLAAAVPDITIILGGHDHVPLDTTNGRTLILKAGADALSLGRVDLLVTKSGRSRRVEWKWELIPVTPETPEKAEVASVVKQYESLMASQLDVVVGSSAVPLDTRGEVVRVEESAVGNFIADLLRSAMQADVALVNGGGIRGDTVLPAGPLRRRDVLTILPFANKVVKLEVSGEVLREALENGLSQVEKTAGRFPQVAGLRYVFDFKRPAGSRLVSVSVGAEPLDLRRTYSLATFDFLAAGGDGYTVLQGTKTLVSAESGPMDSDLLIERLKAGPIAPALDGRITRSP